MSLHSNPWNYEAFSIPVRYSERWLCNHQFVMNSCALLLKVWFSSLNDILLITCSSLHKSNLVFMYYIPMYVYTNTSKHK